MVNFLIMISKKIIYLKLQFINDNLFYIIISINSIINYTEMFNMTPDQYL